jgi:glyoxylate/hydroxypyruvate reductase A
MKPIIIDLKFNSTRTAGAVEAAFAGREVINLSNPDHAGRDLSKAAYALVWKPQADLFLRAPNLEIIFSGGAGVDHIIGADGVPPEVPIVRFVDQTLTTRMSEWVVLQCLTHLRQVSGYAEQQRAKIWNEFPQPEAKEITVGVMGLGVLGQDSVAKLKAMGFDVIGWSRTKKQIDGIETFDAAGLDDFLSRTDILVGLLPLTPDTTGLYNASLFCKLRQGGALKKPVFVNAGRGKSQNEADLITALSNGTLLAASLDVFQAEPLPSDSPFWSMDNVILTPHAAAASDARALMRHVETEMARFENGEALRYLVDRTVGY